MLLETRQHPLRVGDILLLCSDGLTEMVPDRAIAAILADPVPLPVQAQQLIDAAKAAGGRDNVSVILVHVGQMIKKSGNAGKWWKK